jgi:predicted metal-dependent peptidase
MSQLPLPLIRAKNQVTLKEYFYAVLMMGMKTVINEKMPAAMGTDGKHIYVNPAFIKSEQWTQDHMIFAFMHECIHVMTGDMWWATEMSLDKDLANQAADHWINLTLIAEGKIAPKNCLKDTKYQTRHGLWTKLQIYKDLLNQQQGQQGTTQGNDPFKGDVIPVPPDPNLKAEIGLRVKAAVQAAKSCGGPVPTWAADMVEDMAKPKVNWKRRLFHLASTVTFARTDYSYRRHNRRYIPQGIIAPTLYNPDSTIGEIVCAVDTSGSVSQEELEQFWGEIVEILKNLQPRKMWVLDVDTDIRKTRCYTPEDEIPTKVEVSGRGGTSFIKPFDWIEDRFQGIDMSAGEDFRPQMLIYLTDLEGGFPANAPTYPVIWVSTTDLTAPFGETIHIDMGRDE